MVHQAGTFSLPLDGILVHCRVTSSTAFPGTHTLLYSWVERGHPVRKVSCTRAKHNVLGQGPDCSTRTFTTFRLLQFWSILSFKKFGLWNPSPLDISSNPPSDLCGYFLQQHAQSTSKSLRDNFN